MESRPLFMVRRPISVAGAVLGALALVVGLLVPDIAGAGASGGASRLSAGSSLAPGASIASPRGRYRLTMQKDGNLVLRWLSRPIFASNTEHHPGAYARMQHDGNLVVYDGKRALWSSRTGGHGSASFELLVQDDGDLTIQYPSGVRIWSSRTETKGVRVMPEANPAFSGSAGDPNVVSYKGVFYAFTTGTALGNHIQALVDTSGNPGSGWRSYTGKSYGSSALPTSPWWEQPNTQTSPGVVHYGGHWLMFYDASTRPYPPGTGHSCISVATAASISPTRPVFADYSRQPLLCQPQYGGVLDPSPIVDPRTGKAYLVWKSNDGSSYQASHIWSQQLNASGTGLTGLKVMLLTNNTVRFPWETTLDDPNLVYARGRYLLIFSVGYYLGTSYSEAFATCGSPRGPCYQPGWGPFLASYGNAAGPGGGSLFTNGAGNWWIDYAAWRPGCIPAYGCGGTRRLFVAPFDPGGTGG